MMEIKFDGVEVPGDMMGMVAGYGEIIIRKLSSSGMLFEASFRMTMNSRCTIQISRGDEKVTLYAKVVSLLMKSPRKTETAVEFENLGHKEKIFVRRIVEETLEEKMPEIQNSKSEIRKSKFRSSD